MDVTSVSREREGFLPLCRYNDRIANEKPPHYLLDGRPGILDAPSLTAQGQDISEVAPTGTGDP